MLLFWARAYGETRFLEKKTGVGLSNIPHRVGRAYSFPKKEALMRNSWICLSAMGLLAGVFCGAGTYSGGSGTAEDPYTLSSAADWQSLTAAPEA